MKSVHWLDLRYRLQFLRFKSWLSNICLASCCLFTLITIYSQLWYKSAPVRLQINATRTSGSDDLAYPPEVDLPEIIRLTRLKQPIPIKAINDPKFEWTSISKRHCSPHGTGGAPELVVLIKSALEHFPQREAIRKTWGMDECWGGRRVVVVFLFGSTSPDQASLREKISAEAEKYGDIVQRDFIDRYHNNTYKLLMGFDWALRFCSRTPIFMFADDDHFIYPRNVISFIEGLSQGMLNRFLGGFVMTNIKPVRGGSKAKMDKWFVTPEEYSDSHFPNYVLAGTFFVSYEMAWEISVAARYTKYLKIDDVYLGIILHKLGYSPFHLRQVFSDRKIDQASSDINTFLSSHEFRDPNAVVALWVRLNGINFCSFRYKSKPDIF